VAERIRTAFAALYAAQSAWKAAVLPLDDTLKKDPLMGLDPDDPQDRDILFTGQALYFVSVGNA
jgi:hypothetical protein